MEPVHQGDSFINIGTGNIIGDKSSSHISNYQSSDHAINMAVLDFIRAIESDPSTSNADRNAAVLIVKELENTLIAREPDLGILQKFKNFLQEKGGTIAAAGLGLLANTAVKVVVEQAVKHLLQ